MAFTIVILIMVVTLKHSGIAIKSMAEQFEQAIAPTPLTKFCTQGLSAIGDALMSLSSLFDLSVKMLTVGTIHK